MADQIMDEPKDVKPVIERKDDDWADRGKAYDAGNEWNAPGTADANNAPMADESAIGSPDVFLTERYRQHPRGAVKILQVKADGAHRSYVVTEGTKVGYFELAEGMSRPEAEEALNGAFDGTAVVV